jgi:hypothetical protein
MKEDVKDNIVLVRMPRWNFLWLAKKTRVLETNSDSITNPLGCDNQQISPEWKLLKSEFRRETDALVFDFISICWDRIM